MAEVHQGRWTAEIEGDFVVFLIGARINSKLQALRVFLDLGGRRGPDLTTVGTRLTRDQLIDQVSNGTPGGGNMPAYGKQMKPNEMAALIEFLVSLRPDGQPPARNPADAP